MEQVFLICRERVISYELHTQILARPLPEKKTVYWKDFTESQNLRRVLTQDMYNSVEAQS